MISMPVVFFVQIDVSVHVEPDQLHSRQCPEQDVLPVVVGVGCFRPVGGPRQGQPDQGVLPQHFPRQLAGRALPAR